MEAENTDAGLPNDEFDLAFAVASGEVEDNYDLTTKAEEMSSTEESGDSGTNTEITEDLTASAGKEDTADSGSSKTVAPEVKEVPKKEEPKVDLEAKAAADAKELADVQAAEAAEVPTDDEISVLESIKEDFPEVRKAFEIQERLIAAKMENRFAKRIKELESRFEQRIAPAETVARQVARSTHEAEILKVHDDAFSLLPDVEKWVSEKPSFVKQAFNTVLDSGSAAEIVELLSIFKKEVGSAHSQTPDEEARQKAEAIKAEADKAVKDKKLKSMEHVRGRQTAQKSGIDENDFESAFNSAANS